MVLTGVDLRKVEPAGQIGVFSFCCSCVRVAFTIQKSFAKQKKEKSSSNSSRCAWPSGGRLSGAAERNTHTRTSRGV